MQKFSYILILLGIFIVPSALFSQEEIASKEELLIEQQQINFETFFFEALQQKAIGNYDKAIYALEECQRIDKLNLAVLFELSKNYFEQNKYTEAEYYGNQALNLQPEDLNILRHLKEINLRQNDYKEAIRYQNLIIAQKPDLEQELIFLYIRSGDVKSAKALMKKLDDQDRLPDSYNSLKESLFRDAVAEQKVQSRPQYEKTSLTELDRLKKEYHDHNDYNSLKKVLEREIKTRQYLLLDTDSKKALDLYPGQPFVYLSSAISLNNLRKYKEAIEVLNTGLEFLVDDKMLESQFMEQLSLSYKALGENRKATEYYNKMLGLRKK
jgi:tetratricopeptide (TPR) repeat protein